MTGTSSAYGMYLILKQKHFSSRKVGELKPTHPSLGSSVPGDTRENIFAKFIKLSLATPCWCPFERHKLSGRKQTETSAFEFRYQKVSWWLEREPINIKLSTVYILRLQAAQTLYGSSLEFEFYKKMYEKKQNTI